MVTLRAGNLLGWPSPLVSRAPRTRRDALLYPTRGAA
jgi:hypothetical protein